jgi:hypothetical protein
MNELFGTGVFDGEDFLKLIARFGLDLGFATLIVLSVYYRRYRNREFVFTYFIFNIITFFICALLRKVPMELGFALGLFAVFGILRYRTQEIKMHDLTYMFIVIGIGIINSVSNKQISLVELLTVNAVIVSASALIEFHPTARLHSATPVRYDNLALLQHGRESELHKDLSQRTGLEVVRVQVHRIDLLRDAAELTAFSKTQPDAAAEGPRPLPGSLLVVDNNSAAVSFPEPRGA